MAFKAIILLKRNETLSREAFVDWWLNEHAALAAQLPGLRKLCFNLTTNEEDPLYDGVSELWFDTRADFEAAYQSSIGQQVAQDSLSKMSKRDRLLVQENDVVAG